MSRQFILFYFNGVINKQKQLLKNSLDVYIDIGQQSCTRQIRNKISSRYELKAKAVQH